jgi:hypothetical protein
VERDAVTNTANALVRNASARHKLEAAWRLALVATHPIRMIACDLCHLNIVSGTRHYVHSDIAACPVMTRVLPICRRTAVAFMGKALRSPTRRMHEQSCAAQSLEV